MRKQVRHCLKAFDIYGYPVSLNFQNQSKYKSEAGGIFSVITILIILFIGIDGLRSLLNKQTYYIQSWMSIDNSPQAVTLNQEQFNLFFQIKLLDGSSFNFSQYFNITISQESVVHLNPEQNHTTGQYQTTSNQINLIRCKYQDYQDVLENNQLFSGDFLCPSPEYNFSFQGTRANQVHEYLKINIQTCHDQGQCLTGQEMSQIMKSKSFQIQYGILNQYYETFGNELKTFIYTGSFLFDFNHFTQADIFLNALSQWTNKFQNGEDIKQLILRLQFRQYFKKQIRVQRQGQFAEINLLLSQTQVNYKRINQRLDQYLAYFGGIVQAVIYLMTLLVQNYNMFRFYTQLANRFYTFDLKPDTSLMALFSRRKRIANEQLTIDEISQRIRNRVERIKRTVERFQKGAKLLVKRSKFVSMMSKSSSKQQANNTSQKIQNDYGSPINSPLNQIEMDSDIYYISKDPSAQSVKVIDINTNMTRSPLRMKKNGPTFAASKPQEKIQINPENSQKQQGYSNRHDFLQDSIQDIMKYSRHIRMSILYLLNQLFCLKFLFKQNDQIILLDRAVKMLTRDTDIVTILFKLQDIDKIKRIMFTRDQQMIFNYTPKPIVRAQMLISKQISFQEEDLSNPRKHRQTVKDLEADIKYISKQQQNKKSLLQGRKKFQSMKSYFKLYNAYDRLQQQTKMNMNITQEEVKLNKKLMHLVGEELKQIFEVSQYIDDQLTQTNIKVCETKAAENRKQIISQLGEKKINQSFDLLNDEKNPQLVI